MHTPRIIADVEIGMGDRPESISPLEGEMPGRAEGGGAGYQLRLVKK
jgi:hypothetical protein